jgi:hypothetical protein
MREKKKFLFFFEQIVLNVKKKSRRVAQSYYYYIQRTRRIGRYTGQMQSGNHNCIASTYTLWYTIMSSSSTIAITPREEQLISEGI